VTGWIDPILISGAWACKKSWKSGDRYGSPAAAEYLRKVRRLIFFFMQNPLLPMAWKLDEFSQECTKVKCLSCRFFLILLIFDVNKTIWGKDGLGWLVLFFVGRDWFSGEKLYTIPGIIFLDKKDERGNV